MFDHEFSNRNYILLSQLESLKDIDSNVLDKFKSQLDIDTTSKIPRINIYDVFTLYALLNKEPNELDIKRLLDLHKMFVKNYVDESKLQMEDDYLLYDFLDSFEDKLEGGKDQTMSERVINNLNELRNNIKKYDDSINQNSVQYYNRKMFGGDEFKKIESMFGAVKSNKHMIDNLHDEMLKSELNELLEEIETDYENINRKIETFKTENDILIDNIKTIVNDETNETNIEDSNEVESNSTLKYISIILLICILVACIICYYVIKSSKRSTTIEINNKPKIEKDVSPFNLTNEISLKVNDVNVKVVNKTKNTSYTEPKKQLTTELDILKSELDRNINKILDIKNEHSLTDIEPITIQYINETESEPISNPNQNAISNELLHKLEENKVTTNQEELFGNLELI